MRRLTILFLICFMSLSAQADVEKFKDAIWSDCALATSETEQFTIEEKEDAVTFLIGIINLDLGKAAQNPLINPGLVKVPEGIMSDVSLAQSLDPERPNRAKKCVAEILPKLIPQSEIAIPPLLVKSEDLTINYEVRSTFARQAYNLAQMLSTQKVSSGSTGIADSKMITDSTYDQIFSLYLDKNTALREEVLLLFPAQLVVRISSNLVSSTCSSECQKERELAKLMSKVNLQLSTTRDASVSLLRDLKPELRLYVFEALQHSVPIYESILKYILENFDFSVRLENSHNPEQKQLYANLNSIFDFELRSASFAIDPLLRLKLINAFENNTSSNRDILEKGLSVIAPLYKGFMSSVKILATSKDSDIRARAARLLARVSNPSGETRKLLESLLTDSSIMVQQVALGSSLGMLDSKSLLLSATKIQSAIKKQKSLKHLSTEQALDASLDLLRTVSQVTNSSLPALWIKFAFETIEDGLIQNKDRKQLSVALNILKSNGKLTDGELRIFSQSKQSSKRNAAIYVMQSGIVIEAPMLATLLRLLSDLDPIVAKNAQITLLTLTPNLTELLNSTKNLAPSPRLDEIFLESGLRSEKVDEVNSRMKTFSCSEVLELSGACLQKTRIGEFCSMIITQIPRCIESGILDNLSSEVVERALQVQPQIKELFYQSMVSAETKGTDQLAIGLFLLKTKAANEEIVLKMCGFSPIATDSVLAQLASYASVDATSVKKCIPILKSHFEDPNLAGEQRALIFKYILKLEPTSIDVAVIFRDALERRDLAFLRVLSQGELVTELLPILGQILLEESDTSDDQDRIISLKLLEELGQKGISQTPVVLPLLEASNNDLRYQAARTIIAGNSDRTSSVKALRSILNSVYFRKLFEEPRLEGLLELTKSLLDDPHSDLPVGEKRDLLRLLRVLQGPETVMPEPLDNLLSEVGSELKTEIADSVGENAK